MEWMEAWEEVWAEAWAEWVSNPLEIALEETMRNSNNSNNQQWVALVISNSLKPNSQCKVKTHLAASSNLNSNQHLVGSNKHNQHNLQYNNLVDSKPLRLKTRTNLETFKAAITKATQIKVFMQTAW